MTPTVSRSCVTPPGIFLHAFRSDRIGIDPAVLGRKHPRDFEHDSLAVLLQFLAGQRADREIERRPEMELNRCPSQSPPVAREVFLSPGGNGHDGHTRPRGEIGGACVAAPKPTRAALPLGRDQDRPAGAQDGQAPGQRVLVALTAPDVHGVADPGENPAQPPRLPEVMAHERDDRSLHVGPSHRDVGHAEVVPREDERAGGGDVLQSFDLDACGHTDAQTDDASREPLPWRPVLADLGVRLSLLARGLLGRRLQCRPAAVAVDGDLGDGLGV